MTKDQCGDVHVVFFVLDDWNTSAIVPDLYFVVHTEMSHLVGKPTCFPNRSDKNRPVQSQKTATSLKFWI